jgi:hypothetical protein
VFYSNPNPNLIGGNGTDSTLLLAFITLAFNLVEKRGEVMEETDKLEVTPQEETEDAQQLLAVLTNKVRVRVRVKARVRVRIRVSD